MATVSWITSEPTPDPFAVMVGDTREYVVQLCEVSDLASPEWISTFTGFLRRALSSLVDTPSDARRIVFEIDPVYCIMTCVLTDEARTRDEQTIFKLRLRDWDAEMESVPEAAFDDACTGMVQRFKTVLQSSVASRDLSDVVARLRERGFSCWTADYNEHAPWSGIVELQVNQQ